MSRNHALFTPPRPPGPTLPAAFDDLLARRFHGAGNIRGIRYQILYFAWRVFDLYDEANAPDAILGEGLEDVDLRSVRAGNEYAQLKHYGQPLDWGRVAGVITSFCEVLAADPSARFTLVTNVRLTEDVTLFHQHIQNPRQGVPLPVRLRSRLEAALQSAAIGSVTPITAEQFLSRFSIVRLSEQELLQRLYAAVAIHFEVSTGNEELYALSLFSDLANRAGNRIEVRRPDIESVRIRIEQLIALGPVNPAVRDGFVAPLRFSASPDHNRAADYYSGRAARPDHIATGLDVVRPETIGRIKGVLARASVCGIVASSGQGKSTLAYRYAMDGYPAQTIFVVRTCQTEGDVGQIAAFLRSRLGIGLPIAVVIDNLGYRTREWHRLAAELAGEPVSFLVTAREEDWFRYRGSTSGFTWDIVRPELTFEEARRIYSDLKKRNLVLSNVPSARWAYERVRDHRLLIEFVYLLTHGRLLADRLEEQIADMERLGEDPGKLETLRLVSVAQRYGARVRTADLATHVGFRADAERSLSSLSGEYVTFTGDNSECEGLHPVRSDHLVTILHRSLPLSNSVQRLLKILDEANLVVFVRELLADPEIKPEPAVQALSARSLGEPPRFLPLIAQACFDAEERRYFYKHRSYFDEAHRRVGDAMVMMLAMSVLPRTDYKAIDGVLSLESLAGNPGVEWLRGIVGDFSPRIAEHRLENSFLSQSLAKALPSHFAEDLDSLSGVLFWCHDARMDVATLPAVAEALKESRWQQGLLDLPVEAAASLSLALFRVIPDDYLRWTEENKERILGFYKLATRTLDVEEITTEEGTGLRIRFPVEWDDGGASSLNDAAVNRLSILQRLLPQYDVYESLGIYLSGEDASMPYDPTHKRFTGRSVWQEVDTRKNGDWVRFCRGYYAADSLSAWLDVWRILRSDSLILVRKLRLFYVNILKGRRDKASEGINSLGIEALQEKFRSAPVLPTGIPEESRSQVEKLLHDWVAGMTNFLRQFAGHSPTNGEDTDSRLMRINLRNALHGLGDLEKAFEAVTRLTGIPAESEEGAISPPISEEVLEYRRLTEMLDYWFDVWQTRRLRGGNLPNPTKTLDEWTEGLVLESLAAARIAVAPLEEMGLSILLPTRLYQEPPLNGLVVGCQVRDFLTLTTDMIMVLASLGADGPDVDYLYIVPLLPGNRLFRKEIFRVAKDNARKLAAGETPEEPWLLPMEAPPMLLSLLPGIAGEPLGEWRLIEDTFNAAELIARQTSLMQTATQLLKVEEPSEKKLLLSLEEDGEQAIREARRKLSVALHAMETFIPENRDARREAWDRLVTRSKGAIKQIEQGTLSSLQAFASGDGIRMDWELYLNAQYIME